VSIKDSLLKRQGGFTLLELLIVIVIIGILALLIIPNITSAPKKARDTKRKTDITTLRKGLEEYFVNNNVYPDHTAAAPNDGLNALTQGSAPIVKDVPVDPKNTGVLVYTYTSANSNSTYTLKACLENDQDSGANVSTDSTCGSATAKKFEVVNGN
jgi:general secretion pathway protein G